MFNVLITSTMKSEPLFPSVSGVADGSVFSFGGTAGTLGRVADWARAFVAAAIPAAGPAASAAARNWRRFIFGCLPIGSSGDFQEICHPRGANPSLRPARQNPFHLDF